MTLEEAIKHCEEKAAELRKEADDCKEIYKEQCEKPNYKSYISNCLECAEEHEQLAEWLKELRKLKRCRECPLVKEECTLCGIRFGGKE